MSLNQDEIAQLPPKYRPLSAWAYFGYSILYALPIIGFIFLIVFSLSDSNINRRSFSRSYFCVLIIAIIITLIAVATGTFGSLVGAASSGISA